MYCPMYRRMYRPNFFRANAYKMGSSYRYPFQNWLWRRFRQFIGRYIRRRKNAIESPRKLTYAMHATNSGFNFSTFFSELARREGGREGQRERKRRASYHITPSFFTHAAFSGILDSSSSPLLCSDSVRVWGFSQNRLLQLHTSREYTSIDFKAENVVTSHLPKQRTRGRCLARPLRRWPKSPNLTIPELKHNPGMHARGRLWSSTVTKICT